MGHAAFDQSSGGSGGFGAGGFGGGGFSDIFDQMFSNFRVVTGAFERNEGGNDLRYDMSISLEDAFSAYNRIFQLRYHQNAIVAPGRALLIVVSRAPVEHVGVLGVCAQQGFLPLSGLATPVRHGAGDI